MNQDQDSLNRTLAELDHQHRQDRLSGGIGMVVLGLALLYVGAHLIIAAVR